MQTVYLLRHNDGVMAITVILTRNYSGKTMELFQDKSLTVLTGISLMVLHGVMNSAWAEHVHQRPDTHAPIGVMGDHLMDKGEIMFSYRYMKMEMDGNRMGTDSVSTPLPDFMVSPLSMDMDMHMLGVMYAPTEKLTLSMMVPVLGISMDHRVNMNNVEFTTESDGIGDITFAGIYQLTKSANSNLLFNLGLSVPTGSIDELPCDRVQ